MIPANTDVPISFTMTGDTPSAVSWRVSSPQAVLQDWTSLDLTTQSDPSTLITVTVPQALNKISEVFSETNTLGGVTSALNLREGRVVDLLITIPSQAPFQLTQSYVLRASDVLVVMQNSFMVYPEAIEVADELSSELTAWASATDEARMNALAVAYYFLSRLNYEIYYSRDDIYFRSRASWGLPYINTIGRLYNYTATDFLNLDPDFIRSVRKAQVVEADQRMNGDPMLDEREKGILSRKVADSSHTFRDGRPLRFAVSAQALRYLAGYIKYSAVLIRS